MALSSVASVSAGPQTNSAALASGLTNLVVTGEQNKANLLATLSRPLDTNQQALGNGIVISTSA